jgi:hypothetical protein
MSAGDLALTASTIAIVSDGCGNLVQLNQLAR